MSTPAASRSNIILIVTDQQRADYLGCYGHPLLRTPHLDGLAERGVRFERFYVSNPVCMPNRATLMTGRMPSLHGVQHNGIALAPSSNTFVELLRHSGYRTALVGKSHLQPFIDTPAARRGDFGGRPAPDVAVREARKPASDTPSLDQERPLNWLSGPDFPLTRPYYGFEHVRLCTEHGDEVGGHYYHWLAARCADPTALRGSEHGLPHDYVCPQAWRTAVPEELYPTTYVADEAIGWLRANVAAGPAAPFFLHVSFPDPHHPFTPPGRYWDMYRPQDMTLPRSFRAADPDRQPHVAHLQKTRDDGTGRRDTPLAFAVSEREAREAMALTCGSISMIDDAVGRLMSELERLGLADNTIIAFTSDHGDFLGDHQLMLKGPMHFQGLIRVPFIWSEPGLASAGQTSQALCGTIDIARTVLDRAGVAPYNGMQGRSLLPTVIEPGTPGPAAVIVEDEIQRAAYGFASPPRCRTLVTQRHRLTVFHDCPWGELYDLENDPDEIDNLWSDPDCAALKGALALQLVQTNLALAERSPLPTRLA